MIDWDIGYSARYYMSLVDPVSWRDVSSMDITEGSIDRNTDSLRESADVTITEPLDGSVVKGTETWIRLYLEAKQGQSGERIALFTGIATAPERELDGTRYQYKLECYSVLKPASDVLTPLGWYAPVGMSGADLAADLLRVGPAPVTCADTTSPTLTSAIIAEDGETNLTMAQKIIDAIKWEIHITGAGEIELRPQEDTVASIFSALDNDVLELSVTDKQDWYSCPNVFRAVMDSATATARDDDPDSPLSTVSRGREIWMQEDDVTLGDNETLAEYAQRRLTEEQSPSRTISYERRYDPDVSVGDIVTIKYPAESIDGNFKVASQSIELGYNCKTTEEATNV